MAMTCWAPMPMVRVQVSRSSGSTTSPGASVLPSPCSFHVNRFPITNSFGSLRWHIYAAMCRVEAIVTRSPTVANEPHTARDSSCAARERRETPRAVTGAGQPNAPRQRGRRSRATGAGIRATDRRAPPSVRSNSSNTGRAVCSQRTRGDVRPVAGSRRE